MSRRRAIPGTDAVGTTYLVHFDRPFGHARHYAGWARDLAARVARHEHGQGSRLLAAVNAAGIGWHVARTWPETTNAREKAIKDSGHLPRYSPECKPLGMTQPPAARKPHRKEPAMTAEASDHDPGAARAGYQDATRTVAAQYAGGLDLDQIAAHHEDVLASLASDAQTGPGRVYAREYADTARSLIQDLREDAAVARGTSKAASSLPYGTPHPDPVLASKGWQVGRGRVVAKGYVRVPQAQADREAG